MIDLEQLYEELRPQRAGSVLRYVKNSREEVSVRNHHEQPPFFSIDEGVMVTVFVDQGYGYAATSDLSRDGLYLAFREARRWAERSRGRAVIDAAIVSLSEATGEYETAAEKPWESMTMTEKFELLREACSRLDCAPRIVSSEAFLNRFDTETQLFTSVGGRIKQHFRRVTPGLIATASEGAETQVRTLGGQRGLPRQGGLEVISEVNYLESASRLGSEAVELLRAPPCPEGIRDLLIGPAQTMLQVHESIGHPLELDRVLGDERNYAGSTFVRKEDFGRLQYGSRHLNVTFDPGVPTELATYAYDDDGFPARREELIVEGVLQRGLGGKSSQKRLGVPGVACVRASSWNRPGIDRMGNLNMEPGDHSFEEMIAAVERGVFMDFNSSWSIDDSRDKFQFSCEWGQLIENGTLTNVVKNPGYRGTCARFWQHLAMVGDASTCAVLGTLNCGKGEPNQLIGVGHRVPACLIRSVEVFGSDS